MRCEITQQNTILLCFSILFRVTETQPTILNLVSINEERPALSHRPNPVTGKQRINRQLHDLCFYSAWCTLNIEVEIEPVDRFTSGFHHAIPQLLGNRCI